MSIILFKTYNISQLKEIAEKRKLEWVIFIFIPELELGKPQML